MCRGVQVQKEDDPMIIYIVLQYIVNQRLIAESMRKGHRRTQSAYISGSNGQGENPAKSHLHSNEIVKLLQASENKVQSKVINYQRLQVNSMQENNYLRFGNFSISKMGKYQELPKMEIETNQTDLNCIPENSKSSQLSSQKMSKQGGCREDDIPAPPTRKVKQKRASDFKRLQVQRKQKSTSELSFSSRRVSGKSSKKR